MILVTLLSLVAVCSADAAAPSAGQATASPRSSPSPECEGVRAPSYVTECAEDASIGLASGEAGSKPVDPLVDEAVIGAVLEDLITYRGKDSPLPAPFGPPSAPLPFITVPVRFQLSLDTVLLHSDTKAWDRLSRAEIGSVCEAAAHLVSRAAAPAPAFVVRNPRVRAMEAEEENAGLFNRAVDAYAPGYSRGGDLAVVLVRIPWSIHSVDATYVLVRQEGRWKVRLRQFVYHL